MSCGVTQAIVLCAGHGTRLQPLTARRPKPLVPFLNVPLLQHVLVGLRAAGVRRVALNAFHLGEQIADFARRAPVPGVDLHVRRERVLLGTGGGVANLLDWLDPGPTLLLTGDILTDLDFSALVQRHVDSGAEATMALTPRADTTVFGAVETDAAGMLTDIVGLVGRPGVARAVNASVHVLAPRFIARLPRGAGCLVRQGYVPALEQGGRCAAFLHAGAWAELGSLSGWLAAQRQALDGTLSIDAELRAAGGRQRGAHSLVHESACVGPDARLLGGTVVGACSTVGAGAVLDNCLLLPGACVPDGASLAGVVLDAAPAQSPA